MDRMNGAALASMMIIPFREAKNPGGKRVLSATISTNDGFETGRKRLVRQECEGALPRGRARCCRHHHPWPPSHGGQTKWGAFAGARGRMGCGTHFLNRSAFPRGKRAENKLKTAIFGRGTSREKRLNVPLWARFRPLSGQPGIVGAAEVRRSLGRPGWKTS